MFSMSRADAAILLGESSVKIEKVISSCENIHQLEAARKMLINWTKMAIINRVVLNETIEIRDTLEDILAQKALEFTKGVKCY